MSSQQAIRHKLMVWYRDAARDLPWRRTRDPYRIWISEVMLQQTRVQAVLPYYERFLSRFPTIEALAAAPEQELLAAWSGLGYYSRARNLQKAARQMKGSFPDTYEAIAELAGVGEYTAAAVASIAFDLPHAAVDGNVLRVISRLYNDDSDIANPSVKKRFAALADGLLDRRRPGDFNQAMMELGATVCLPRAPQCLLCPLMMECEGRAAGRQNELPVKRRPKATVHIERAVLVIRRRSAILMRQRDAGVSLMAGFWELPERGDLADAVEGEAIGGFRHSITHHQYRYAVVVASLHHAPPGYRWVSPANLKELPLTTITRKALALLERASEE